MSEAARPVPADTGREPRWLTTDEREAWMSLAGLLIKLPAALDAQLQRDAGISTFEYLVLSGLSEAPGRTLRISDLAACTNGSLSRLSHVVTRLERRGWVRRSPCPEDGRYTNVTLTDAGWETVVAAAPGHVETVRRLVIDPLTAAQVRHLCAIGDRILRRVDDDGTCPAAGPRDARPPAQRRNHRTSADTTEQR
ncbi:MAG: MarR family transcriptional regulator [Micromonosporaceae bacterium]